MTLYKSGDGGAFGRSGSDREEGSNMDVKGKMFLDFE